MMEYLFSLMNNTNPCKNLEYTNCESLKAILRNDNPSYVNYIFKEISAHLMATGLCKKALRRIEQHCRNNGNNNKIHRYMDDHPVFESHNEKYKFKRKIESMGIPFDIPDDVVDFKKPHQEIYDMFEKLSGHKIAQIIVCNYGEKRLSIIDVAKCVLIYSKSPLIRKIKEKNLIESLTEEQGYNINVEELL